MIIVDASVLVTALVDDGTDGDEARSRLEGNRLLAPELIDLEILSVLRRLVRAGHVGEARADRAVKDLAALPLERAAHRPLVRRAWELRGNVSSYDAAYVALAELLEAELWTADAKLATAVGPRCEFVLFGKR